MMGERGIAGSPVVSIPGPLSLGDLIDRAILLYRAHLWLLVGTTAIFPVPYGLIKVLLSGLRSTSQLSGRLGELTGLEFIDSVVNLVGFLIIEGWNTLALTALCVALLHGAEPRLRPAIDDGWRRLAAYIGQQLLVALALFVSFLAMVLPLYLAARWMVAGQCLMAERLGPAEALSRSWQLTKGQAWRCLGYMVLLTIFSILFQMVPNVMVSWILETVLGDGLLLWVSGISEALNILTGIAWQPLNVAATVLLYYDLRVRQEGYDLALRIGHLEAWAAGVAGGVTSSSEARSKWGG